MLNVVVAMNDIQIIEQLKGYTVRQICDSAIRLMQNFRERYTPIYDCQEASSISTIASEIKIHNGDLTLEQLVPENVSVLGDLRWLIQRLITPHSIRGAGIEKKCPVLYVHPEKLCAEMQK